MSAPKDKVEIPFVPVSTVEVFWLNSLFESNLGYKLTCYDLDSRNSYVSINLFTRSECSKIRNFFETPHLGTEFRKIQITFAKSSRAKPEPGFDTRSQSLQISKKILQEQFESLPYGRKEEIKKLYNKQIEELAIVKSQPATLSESGEVENKGEQDLKQSKDSDKVKGLKASKDSDHSVEPEKAVDPEKPGQIILPGEPGQPGEPKDRPKAGRF